MARPALSATRATQVVNYLAGHPDEGFTMSELGRALRVDTASVFAVLAVLAHEGYVVREPRRKTYRLGSSLVAVGQAALDGHPAIRGAREGAALLAQRLGLECLVGVIAGTDLLTVAEAGRPERLRTRPRVGQRLPFMPPLGILGAAFLSEPEREDWLGRIGPGSRPVDVEPYRPAMDLARQHGYDIGLETETRDRIGLLLMELGDGPASPVLRARLEVLVAALGREQHQLVDPMVASTYRINNIQVPIFGARGEFVAGLTLLGFPASLAGAEVQEYLRNLVETARAITRASGGRPPFEA